MVEKIIQQETENINTVFAPAEKENSARRVRRPAFRVLRALGMKLRAASMVISERAETLRGSARRTFIHARAALANAGRHEVLPRSAGLAVLFAAVAVVITGAFVGVGEGFLGAHTVKIGIEIHKIAP